MTYKLLAEIVVQLPEALHISKTPRRLPAPTTHHKRLGRRPWVVKPFRPSIEPMVSPRPRDVGRSSRRDCDPAACSGRRHVCELQTPSSSHMWRGGIMDIASISRNNKWTCGDRSPMPEVSAELLSTIRIWTCRSLPDASARALYSCRSAEIDSVRSVCNA